MISHFVFPCRRSQASRTAAMVGLSFAREFVADEKATHGALEADLSDIGFDLGDAAFYIRSRQVKLTLSPNMGREPWSHFPKGRPLTVPHFRN